MTFNIGNTYIISLHTVWNITIKSIFVHGYKYIIAYMVTTNWVRINLAVNQFSEFLQTSTN